MSAVGLVTGGVLGWLAVAVAVGAVLGRNLRASGGPAVANALFDTEPLLHCCSRCGRSVQYFAFESVADVRRIHEMLFCVAAPGEIRRLREE